MHIVYSASNVM